MKLSWEDLCWLLLVVALVCIWRIDNRDRDARLKQLEKTLYSGFLLDTF